MKLNFDSTKTVKVIIPILLAVGYIVPSTYPKRIISLGPTITEEIYLLGVGDRLLADTIYCRKPPEAQKKIKIGTVREVNLEKVVSLKPDLVLTTSLTDPKTKEKLNNLKIRVVDFPTAKSFDDLCKQFLELGEIIGEKKKAEKAIAAAKQKVDFIKKKVDNFQKPRVFVQVGARPLFTVTKDSFVNDFIKLAGGINIASDAKNGIFSREEVVRRNPDVIIIATMGIIGEDEKKVWQRYKTINAARNNRIYIVNSEELCSPTPINFPETLKEMVKILYPEKREGR